jgi:hypothetical protein
VTTTSFVETVLRPLDLFYVQFEFVNLSLEVAADGSARLDRVAGQPASIVIRLPPQHIAEEIFRSADPRRFPYNAALASPSRLAFDIPNAVALPAFSLEAILRFIKGLPLRLADLSLGTGPATVIELPFRVLLGPAPGAHVFHRSTPLPNDDPANDFTWTGLWSTRVAAGVSIRSGGSNFRALPNPVDTTPLGFNTTLNANQRREIATRSQSASTPFVIASQPLVLSALGASAQLKSTWPQSASTVLSLWEHHTVVGRDAFVRTVEQGYLFPFGHRASKEMIFRRDFAAFGVSAPGAIAELQQQVFIKVEEPEKNYASAVGYDHDGREMPLKHVRIGSQPASLPDDRSPVRLTVTASDSRGHVVNLDLAVLFISDIDAANPAALVDASNRYLADNTAALMPQPMALADDPEARGDTTLTVTGLTFGVKLLETSAQPPFLPLMQNATVSMPAVEQLLGSVSETAVGNKPPTTTLTLHNSYLNGFASGDVKQVFAKLAPPLPALPIPAERAGGLTAPRFSPNDGLSRVRGLISNVDDFATETSIDPEKIIADAKLLGMISLKALIDGLQDNVPVDDPAKLFDTIEQSGVFATRPILTSVQTGPEAVEVRFLWKPRLKANGLPPLVTPLPSAPGPMALTIRGRITKAPAAPTTFEIDGTLVNFGLAFVSLTATASLVADATTDPLVTVDFRQVAFKSGAGKKLDFATDIADVRFGSGLDFVKNLLDLLPKGDLGNKVQVDPKPDGVTIRFGAAVPSFAIGVLSIENIAVSTSISLPFVDGVPAAVRFALSERNQPFQVSVSIFGGTGFFALEVRTDGSMLMEVAIEFGGVVSIDLLGIVRGGVYLFAGVYVALGSGNEVIVSGYLRLGGYVDVAGIISVSIEVYIGLTYDSNTKLLLGQGSVTISVKVLFFSLTKSFTVTRKIAGFGDAPTDAIIGFAEFDTAPLPHFTDTMTRFQWDQYCKAFA